MDPKTETEGGSQASTPAADSSAALRNEIATLKTELGDLERENKELNAKIKALTTALRSDDNGPEFNAMMKEKVAAGLSVEQAREATRSQLAADALAAKDKKKGNS